MSKNPQTRHRKSNYIINLLLFKIKIFHNGE
jgi:hypothetical protein